MDAQAASTAMVIHLVGPPGVGKSHLGSALAGLMGMQVVDAADHPSRQIGRTDWPFIDKAIRTSIGVGLSVVLVSTGLSRGAWETIEASPVPVHTITLVPSSTAICRDRIFGRSRRRAGPSLERILTRWEAILADPGATAWPGLKFAIRHPITFEEEADLEGLRRLVERLGG